MPQKETDGFYTYEFSNAWVDENGDDVDLTNVTATKTFMLNLIKFRLELTTIKILYSSLMMKRVILRLKLI